jgi:serine/threonine protein kinase
VLYSHRQESWKLADFGTAAEGTSRRGWTTNARRGTACYRAPEVINEVRPLYNNKSDIWALGCILYKLVTKEKAFNSDWEPFNTQNQDAHL